MKRQFLALPDYYLYTLRPLTDEEYGRLVRKLMHYSMDGTPIPTDTGGNERYFAVYVMLEEDQFQKTGKFSLQ